MNQIRGRTFLQASFWMAATVVGVIAVVYAKLINFILQYYFQTFSAHPYWVSIATPFLFVLAVALVVKISPEAKGSGIPQVLEAIHDIESKKINSENSSLISIRTAVVKVISSFVGFIAGASIGREGPTVQIASSIFAWVGNKVKKNTSYIEPQAYLIAGGAAGVSAAFNTPLAGITFALEEIAEGMFANFRRPVMFSIIFAGIIAQGIVGDYLYFGHPIIPKMTFSVFPQAIAIGLVAGFFGALFARILAQKDFKFAVKQWWLKAFICGVICSLIGFFSNGDTSGSGYEVVRHFMDSDTAQISYSFGIAKFVSTIFSYLSGMAGGIFSPCLSIGAGIGSSLAALAHLTNLKTCAMIGMVAFFSGAVQAPITAVVIVMEMTDEHSLIIPFMIAALIAQALGKLLMPIPLYKYLATQNRTKTT